MLEMAKLILILVILVLPFQLLGAVVYHLLARSNPARAHIFGAAIPALTFFAVFLALFLWRYYHPGMMLLVEGGINLIILVVLLAGTFLHLFGGVIAHYILYRRHGPG